MEADTTSPKSPPPINAAKLNLDETPAQVKERNIKEALARAAIAPDTGFKPVDVSGATVRSPPPPQQPPPQPIPVPQTPQAFYEAGKIDGYVSGFLGASIILIGGYLGYRIVSWAWCKPAAAAKVVANATTTTQ